MNNGVTMDTIEKELDELARRNRKHNKNKDNDQDTDIVVKKMLEETIDLKERLNALTPGDHRRGILARQLWNTQKAMSRARRRAIFELWAQGRGRATTDIGKPDCRPASTPESEWREDVASTFGALHEKSRLPPLAGEFARPSRRTPA